MSEEHCKDCCCARAWEALGITGYTGKSIPEHIVDLRTRLEAWQTVGDSIMKSICGSTEPLSDSDVIGAFDELEFRLATAEALAATRYSEIERLESKLEQSRKLFKTANEGFIRRTRERDAAIKVARDYKDQRDSSRECALWLFRFVEESHCTHFNEEDTLTLERWPWLRIGGE